MTHKSPKLYSLFPGDSSHKIFIGQGANKSVFAGGFNKSFKSLSCSPFSYFLFLVHQRMQSELITLYFIISIKRRSFIDTVRNINKYGVNELEETEEKG